MKSWFNKLPQAQEGIEQQKGPNNPIGDLYREYNSQSDQMRDEQLLEAKKKQARLLLSQRQKMNEEESLNDWTANAQQQMYSDPRWNQPVQPMAQYGVPSNRLVRYETVPVTDGYGNVVMVPRHAFQDGGDLAEAGRYDLFQHGYFGRQNRRMDRAYRREHPDATQGELSSYMNQNGYHSGVMWSPTGYKPSAATPITNANKKTAAENEYVQFDDNMGKMSTGRVFYPKKLIGNAEYDAYTNGLRSESETDINTDSKTDASIDASNDVITQPDDVLKQPKNSNSSAQKAAEKINSSMSTVTPTETRVDTKTTKQNGSYENPYYVTNEKDLDELKKSVEGSNKKIFYIGVDKKMHYAMWDPNNKAVVFDYNPASKNGRTYNGQKIYQTTGNVSNDNTWDVYYNNTINPYNDIY